MERKGPLLFIKKKLENELHTHTIAEILWPTLNFCSLTASLEFGKIKRCCIARFFLLKTLKPN